MRSCIEIAQLSCAATVNEDGTHNLSSKASLSMAELGAETLEYLMSQRRSRGYLYDFKRLLHKHVNPAIGEMQLGDVTPQDIERIVRSLKDKPSTGNFVLSVLSRMFKLALRWQYRVDDPTFGVEKFPMNGREPY